MIPHERSLVQRLQGRPFVMLGVDTDAEVSDYRKGFAKKPTSWRNWLDGSGGPISTRWAIQAYPDVYLLDANGVIRSHQCTDEKQLDADIETLLKETEAKTSTPAPQP